ncbi:hypothetical protein H5410_027169, partial [Solanum commersonii]
WKNIEVHCNNDQIKVPGTHPSQSRTTQNGYSGLQRRNFGREEYWVCSAAFKEAHWESVSYMRLELTRITYPSTSMLMHIKERVLCFKEKMFWLGWKLLQVLLFFVAVKKEEKNVTRTVLNNIAGTLDLSIRKFVQRERYPGEIKRLLVVMAHQEPFNSHKYVICIHCKCLCSKVCSSSGYCFKYNTFGC